MNRTKFVCLAGLFACGVVSAADWYAKDNLQGGHDPSMVRFEDGYALMTTNNQLSLWTTEDMVSWKAHGKTMTSFPKWIYTYAPTMEDVWAPDIYKFDDEFRVYYCGSVFGKRTSAIGYTASKSMVPGTSGYGWTDKGHVFHTVASDKYNAIDADVIKTSAGEYWMAFGSFGLGIQLIKLNGETGYQASDDKTVYNIARRVTTASGGAVEGPSLIEHDGKFFLFTAWDKCCQQGANIEQTTYKTAMGRADKVTGPYYDRDGKDLASGGGTILLERYGRYVGPGGGEPFQDINRVRFVHHYYDNAGDKYNHIHIRDVVFTDDNWAEMGQPFLGRYLSAEAEHGALTRAVSGDLAIATSKTASNGEYLSYVNTEGSKIRLPMNIPQAGEYLLRYRYANGGEGAATHGVSINGKEQTVKLPPTGSWGTFPENSTVMIPATLKRGGNFIEVRPIPNNYFSELDRIDFLRVIRDTIPGNGFDNGIRIRLDENDQLAMKDGGYAIFENVVTDSIKSTDVRVMVKGSAGKLALRLDSKAGTVVSECDLSKGVAAANGWSEVTCSTLGGSKKLTGVQDFYLTASGVSGEVVVGNMMFKASAVIPSSSSAVISSSSSDVIPGSSSSVIPSGAEGSSSDSKDALVTASVAARGFTVTRMDGSYLVRLNLAGAQKVYLLNSMGQVVASRDIRGAMAGTEVRFENLPKANYIVKVK
ncbi:family 43 glycosylhydrolase [Fibrobacter sp. UWEL]|uniref:family 43 glycosylhydrolase n=1 Tax=Fibrobacter sp. UWEL TaxID=1896209 RepID=UPI0009153024|nr:family 43 glycosylhydrolase [Fibrobacter sp. UWEL]SHK45412.1 arabinan endo-1,5-alpha-L-arabinosidase [Fibrobacter sp. UWEL]